MSVYDSPAEAAHDLLRHIPPKDIAERLNDVIRLNPDLTDELLSTTDVPLETEMDPNGGEFIKCDYNRDCDSYRSPYTNEYFPPLPDGVKPSEQLRALEEMALTGFQAYRKLYFGDGTLSIYCWDGEDADTFGVGVFVRKDIESETRDATPFKGSISTSDIIEVRKKSGKEWTYDMVSSVLLFCELGTDVGSPIVLSGGVADSSSVTAKATDNKGHLMNIGKMVEANAATFLEKVKQIYVSKMKEIFTYTKKKIGSAEIEERKKMLAEAMIARLGDNKEKDKETE